MNVNALAGSQVGKLQVALTEGQPVNLPTWNQPAMSTTQGYLDMELLRFTTAGSVDYGKITLIGRLRYDTKQIFEDQLEAVERASAKRSGHMDDKRSEAAMEDRKKEGYF